MLLTPALDVVLRKLPPVPSAVPLFKTTLTQTVNETTTTWTGVDIGVAHPKRIVILAVYHGVAAACTATVNGIDYYSRAQNTAHEFSILACQVMTGTTATITASATGSIRKAAMVFIAYPNNPFQVSNGTATANTTTNATLTNVRVAAGGFTIFCGGQHATVEAFSTTWGGVDAVTESVDAQLESAASHTAGFISHSVSSNTNTLTLAETVSGTKRLVQCTWGPPAPYAGLAI